MRATRRRAQDVTVHKLAHGRLLVEWCSLAVLAKGRTENVRSTFCRRVRDCMQLTWAGLVWKHAHAADLYSTGFDGFAG